MLLHHGRAAARAESRAEERREARASAAEAEAVNVVEWRGTCGGSSRVRAGSRQGEGERGVGGLVGGSFAFWAGEVISESKSFWCDVGPKGGSFCGEVG